MSRPFSSAIILPVGLAIVSVVALSGCGGGGGGGGGNPSGTLLGVSFFGADPGPGVPPGTLPTVFRDQTLQFTFDGPLDPGVLGGFFSQGGVVVEFSGVPAAGSQAIPYYAFNDQNQARTSLQIRVNVAGGPFLSSYVVGRHRDNPNVIVVDPRIPANHPMGLPSSQGFTAATHYVYIIPAGNAFRFGGVPAQPVGPSLFALPIPIPAFTTQPQLSVLFLSSNSFGPDPIPPQIVSVVPLSGASGAPGDPIPTGDPLIITFSKIVSSASIDPLKNLIVRNIDVQNQTYPEGILVPGSLTTLTPMMTDDSVYIFTPSAQYGPGVSPTEGFDIEVRVGSFGQPPAVVPPILGQPTGLSGTQLPLSNSLAVTFRTTPCTACVTPASIIESFDDTTQQDATYVQVFPGTSMVPGPKQCRWNDSSAVGQLAGRLTSGSPFGNNAQTLGTRIQFIVDPMPHGAGGLFSPFDASLANSGGQCPAIPTGCNLGINPGGGSHIMHIYESTELGTTEDSLELIEWSSVSGVTAASTYPNYKIWCGVTSKVAPLTGGGSPGLTSVFDANYNLTPFQTGIPVQTGCADLTAANPRKVPCGGPMPYVVMLQTTQFYPFPTLNPPFDFARSDGTSGGGANPTNLLFEQDIDPGNQVPNFNVYRATAFTPVRRLIDKPISLVTPGLCPFNNGGQFDIYKHRFTFVGVYAECRSLYYDTGAPNPDYFDFILSPPVSQQPAGTSSVWILEGTDASNPGPGTIGSPGVYIDASGATNPNVLDATIHMLRYFRFKAQMRSNNVTNQAPAYNSVVMAYGF